MSAAKRKRRRTVAAASKKRKKRSSSGLLCLLALFILIPVMYGLYLYYNQPSTEGVYSKTPKQTPLKTVVQRADKTFKNQPQIPIEKYEELEIPLPLTPREQQIIRHTGYTVSYNPAWRIPNWVGYELTREETMGLKKRNNKFLPDPLVKGATAANSDYTRSGYDKGHMAPAADMKWSSQVMNESFYFSNICPQHPQLNQRSWKVLEEKARKWAQADSAIVIVCGPIVTARPKKIGKNKVVVPKQFFKVILSLYSTPPRAIGFLFDNKQSVNKLSSYAVTVDSIERLTGLDFFAPLPDEFEEDLESAFQLKQWQLN